MPKRTPKLSIGMAHYDDFCGAWFTIQSLRLYQCFDPSEVEILLVDNNPTSEHGKLLRKKAGSLNIRYIPFTEATGPANTKDHIFQHATGDAVLVMDSHVQLTRQCTTPPAVKSKFRHWLTGIFNAIFRNRSAVETSIRRLIRFYDDNPRTMNLHQGPLLHDSLQNWDTHFDPMWRGGMYGIWSRAWQDRSGRMFSIRTNGENQTVTRHNLMTGELEPWPSLMTIPVHGHEDFIENDLGMSQVPTDDDSPPFEIPMQGMGLFSCRREAWLGFPKEFSGFGGEEGFIQQAYRNAGHKTLCLPFLKWLHRFGRPEGVNYPNQTFDRVRNYFIGWQHNDEPVEPIRHHFVDERNFNPVLWNAIAADPIGATLEESLNPRKKIEPPKDIDLSKIDETAMKLFDFCIERNEQLSDHMQFFKELPIRLDDVEHVTEISQARNTSIALSYGRPKRLVSYVARSEFVEAYHLIMESESPTSGRLDWQLFDRTQPGEIDPTDLLVLERYQNGDDLYQALKQYSDRVSRYIAIPWVSTYGQNGKFSRPGMWLGLQRWLYEFDESWNDEVWFMIEHVEEGSGVVVLSRDDRDRLENPLSVIVPKHGPGTELKGMLKMIGITASPDCACNSRAAYMNRQGVEWCERNVLKFEEASLAGVNEKTQEAFPNDGIVGWMKQESDRRGLPFIESAVLRVVNLANLLAKRKRNKWLKQNREKYHVEVT